MRDDEEAPACNWWEKIKILATRNLIENFRVVFLINYFFEVLNFQDCFDFILFFVINYISDIKNYASKQCLYTWFKLQSGFFAPYLPTRQSAWRVNVCVHDDKDFFNELEFVRKLY